MTRQNKRLKGSVEIPSNLAIASRLRETKQHRKTAKKKFQGEKINFRETSIRISKSSGDSLNQGSDIDQAEDESQSE